MVTRENIVNGIIKYAKTEIVNNISDKSVRMMFAAAVKSLELIPSLSEKIFENPLVAVVLREENGKYNLETAFQILAETMDEYGDFPLTVPVINAPLVFSKDDVRKLKEYIERSADND